MSDINKLYANLKEDGYQLGSESEFISNLKNPEKAKKFYENMRSDGYNLGEWNDFQGKAGIPFPSRVTEKATDKIPSFVNHEETPLTKEDIKRMSGINAQMQHYVPSVPENVQITPKSVTGKSVGVNDYAGIVQRNPEALKNIILPPEAQQHLEDNKVITGYKQDNPEVSSTPTPVYGIDANEEKRLREYYASDPQGKKEYDQFLNKLDSYKYQLEDSEKRLKQRETEIRKQYKEEIASAPKDVNNPNPVNDPNELNNRIANELSLQKKELKNAKNIIDTYQQGKYEGTFAQMWGEIKRKAPTVFASTLSLGLSDVKNSLDDYQLTKKFNEKGFENLSIPEQDALTTRAIGSYLQNTIGRKRTYAQDAIGSIVDMVPYMAIYGGSNKIAKGATSTIGLAGKATTMPEKIGVGVLESAIQTLIQPSSINQAIQNINGQTNFDVDNEGKIIYTGQDSGMSFGKAIGKAFVANMVENTSEKGGEVLDIWGNGLRNMLNKKIPQLGRAITSYQNTGVHSMMRAAGFNSLPSEFLEEQFATIGHAVAGDGQGNWKDLIDPRQQLLTATSILAIGSAAGVVSIPQIAARNIQIGKIKTAAKKAEQFFDSQFSEQGINEYIKDKIKNGTLKEQQDVLKTVFEDDFSTENQKKAAYDLFKANLLTQGMIGAEKQMTADNATALEQEGRTVFEKTQQKPNSGTMFAINNKVNEMEAKLGDEFAFMTTEDLIDYLDTEDLTPEKTREIEDYLGERSLLSGAIQAMNDKAQQEINQIHAEIDNTTRKDGTRLVVQTPVVNNEHAQTIYITDGNIALDDNGNIVRTDSDTTLIGVNDKGEPVELTINDISKASYQNAQEAKDKIAEDIQNRYTQQFSQEAETNPIDVKKQEGAEIQWFENGKPHQGIVIDKADGVVRIQEGKKIVLKNETELNEQIKNPNTQYHREDIVSLYIDVNQYEGEITADADADGKYSVHVSGYPGKKNFELTADEITAMQTAPVADETAPVQSDITSDNMSANKGENAITSTGETRQNVREYPKNKKGEIDFDKMDIATTFDYLKETEGEDVALEGLELSLKSVQKKIAANIKAVQDFDTKKYAELKKAETIQEQAKIRAKQKETAERLSAERIELDKQKAELQGLLPQVQAPVQQPVNEVKKQAVQEQPVIEDETEDSPLQVEAVTEQQPTVTPEPVKHTVDLTGSKAVREKTKSTNVTDNQKRLKALGDYINLDDYILRTIAEGMKFSWKDKAGSKGLGSEFRYEESERKARFNILSADGATPEEFAHAIYELSGSYEIPGLSGMDWMDILNEVHYATRMYTSTKQCLEAAEAMRNVEEMYGVSEEELNNVTEEEMNAIPDEISDEEFFEIIGIANFTPEQQEELYNLINEYNEPEQTIRGNEAGSQETDSPQPQERSPQNEETGKEREITPSYSNGDTVTYKGKQYEINGIGKDEAGNIIYDLEQNGNTVFEDVIESELSGDPLTTEQPSPTQKQPWEMTREEIGKLYSQELKKIDEKFGRTININSKTKQDVFKKLQNELDNHKAIIQQALSEGKQVPENVLADYPELKKEEVKAEVKNEIPSLTEEQSAMTKEARKSPTSVRELADMDAEDNNGYLSAGVLTTVEQGQSFRVGNNRTYTVTKKSKPNKVQYENEKFKGEYTRTSVTIKDDKGKTYSFEMWDDWTQNGKRMVSTILRKGYSRNSDPVAGLSRDIEGDITIDLINEYNQFHDKSDSYKILNKYILDVNRKLETSPIQPTPEQPTKQPTLPREPKEVLQERKRLATEEKNRLTKLLSGKAIDMFREQSENELEAGTFDATQTNNRINELRAIEKELDAQIKLAEQSEKQGTEEAQGQQEVSFEEEKPVEPKSIEDMAKEAVKKQAEPSFSEKYDALLTQNTARTRMEADDLMRANKSIEELKSLLDLKSVKTDMELPKEILSRIQYLERHPELQEAKQEENIPLSEQDEADQIERAEILDELTAGEIEQIDDFGEKIGGARKDMDITRTSREKDTMPAWRRKYYFTVPGNVMTLGEKVDTSKPFVVAYDIETSYHGRKSKSKKVVTDIKEGRNTYTPKIFTSEQEAEDYIPVFEVIRQGFRVRKGADNYYIYKISSTGKVMEFDNFKTEAEATAYIASTDGSISLLNRKREDFSIPSLEKAERTGKDWRNGKNISTEELMSTFGFRGGEFGNWVKPEERRVFLNTTYDSFMDLAELLGISPKAISLGGNLAIAFGSRGSGGFDSAAAHYEPGRAVINMTRLNGTGALAHEWAHALDNYFGLQDRKQDYTKDEDGKLIHSWSMLTEGKSFKGGMRGDLLDLFMKITDYTTSKQVTQLVGAEENQHIFDKIQASVKDDADRLLLKLKNGVRRSKYNRKTKKYDEVVIKATEEQYNKVKELTDIIATATGGEVKWQALSVNTLGDWAYLSDEIREIETIYKSVFGSTGLKRNGNGYYNLTYYANKLKEAKQKLDDAKSGKTETVKVATDYYTNSKQFDKQKATPYWATKLELFARSFEGYINTLLQEKGVKSDYLQYDKAPVYKAVWGISPYAEGEELATMNKMWKEFFNTIQEDANGAMFQSISPIGFYSTVEKALEAINQEKGTKDQFKAMLLKNGAKQAEMDWMGFDELPEKLTKTDIQNWIDENRIEVEEVVKNQKFVKSFTTSMSDYKILQQGDDFFTENKNPYYPDRNKHSNFKDAVKYLFKNNYLTKDSEFLNENAWSQGTQELFSDTKFSQYTLPGGENYKELLLTMPNKEVDYTKIEKQFGLYELSEELYNKNYDDLSIKELVGLKDEFSKRNPEKVQEYSEQLRKAREKENNKFSSAHYDEPNILAHIRFDERRVGGDTRNPNYGKRVLFIEEFQSDWAQKGKKEGFARILTDKEKEELKNLESKPYGGLKTDEMQRLHELRRVGNIPAMPFSKTDQWVNLAARRMMRYAAENGFDRIAWTTGEQQADRYDLSKQVDEIRYEKVGDNYAVGAIGKNGEIIYRSMNATASELEDAIGKEITQKIVNDEGENGRTKGTKVLSGENLKIGGSGMKAFYDAIVPSAMSKLGKPFGAKVETIEIPETGMQQSIPVTDLMKETAMAGMPLFQSFSNKYDNAATSEERYNAAVEIAKELDAQNETSTIVAKNNEDFISMLPIQYADFVRNNRIGAVLYNGTLIINYVNQINADAIRIAHEHENTHIANNEVHTKADLSKLWDNVPESERRLVSKVYEKMEQSAKGDELIAYAVEDIIKKQGYENYKNGNIDLSLYSQPLQAKLKKTIDYANNKYLANNEGRTKISGSTNKGTNERFQQVNGEGTSTRKRGTANGTDKLPETIEVDGVERSTTNSEGRPIHSTEEGIRNFWKWFGDSKVVDTKGRPLVVYHGTNVNINEFSDKTADQYASFGKAFYFTDNYEEAKNYSLNHKDHKERINNEIKIVSVYLKSNKIFYPSKSKVDVNTIINFIKAYPDYDMFENYTKEERNERSLVSNLYNTFLTKDPFYKQFIKSNIAKADEFETVIRFGEKTGNLINFVLSKIYNFDGVFYNVKKTLNIKENGNHYVVFSPTQIKSATGNNGEFDGNNSDIRFQIIGEQGAANLDKAEESTTRLDNLKVAKEMEKGKTEKQDVDILSSFNYRGTTVNQIENIFWNPGQTIGEEFNEDFIYVSNGFVNAVKEGLTPLETISVLDKNKNGEWHHLFTKNEDGSFDTKYVKFSEQKQFTPKEIRQATGWEKGVDGKWRYETTKHSVHPQLQDYIDKSADGFVKWVNARRNNGLPVTLIDIFGKDDETLKALPQLSKIAVRFSTNAEMEGSTGIFNPFDNEIILNTRIANNAEKIFSVLEHEVQHGVQRLEGFAQGANNEMGAQASAAKRLGFESYDAYIKELKKQEDEIAKLQAEYEEAESAPLYNIKKGIRAIKLEGQLNDMRETISKLQLRTEDLQNSYKSYYNAAGEVEARNMQRRMNFTDEEKRNTLLAETAGVSPEDQIIIMEGLGASMSMTEDEVQAKADKIKREGLKSIVPDYTKFLSNVLKDCPKRKDVVKQANELGWNMQKAIEDYMAEFATKGTSKAEMERITKLLGLEDFSKGEVKMILWENANPNDGTTEWKAKRAITYNNAKDNSIPKFPTSAQIAEYEDSIGNLKLKGMAKVKNFIFRFEESYMNQLASMRVFMDIIGKDGEVPDKYNPYYLSQLRTSAAQTSLERYEKKEYKGLMEAVSNLNNELKKSNGLIYLNKDYKSEKGTIDRATLYSLAKAGLGRNERLSREEAAATYKEVYAALEAKYKEGLLEETEYNNKLVKIQQAEAKLAKKLNETNDYGGLTGLSDLVGSGAMDFKDVRKVVEDIVAEAEKTVDTKAFWETVKKATSYSLKYQYDRGMMTKQMYEHVLNLEPYYLPLRGYDEETAFDLYEYFTSNKGNFNPVLKKAKGHAHLPENPFAHLLSMTASGIMQAENNKVKIALLNLVENNKNDIISIKDTWVRNIGTEEEPEWVEAYPQIPIDATSEEVMKALEDFETQMQALKAEGRATVKSSKLRLTVPIGKGVKSEHAITVKRNGQENTLYVNGNPRLAQAINGMLNPDIQDMSKVLKFAKSINRGMSANFTSRNLEFAITNTMRDIHMAAMLSAIEEGIGYSAKLVKNVAVCQRTLASNLFGSGTKGKYQDYLNEYLENGGQTGFVVLRTIETYNKDVEKLKRSMNKRDALAVPKWIFKQIGDINNMAEQITRFATYVTSREEGRTPVRSAIDAKNITLNFNQKGSGEMGAGWMQSLFLFFNPAMQALYRANQARQKHPARFWTVMGLHGAAGAMIPALAFMMMALIAGDDDDKLERYQQAYWNTPEWIRRNNLMLWIPGTTHFVKIPLGQELRWAYSIGEIGLTKAMGQEKYGTSTGKQALESVSALLPVDIFGASHWYMPGFATPVYEAKVNENFMGKPIYKETPFNTNDPEWTKAYKNTWGSLTSVSKKLNELSGGDDVSKGKIDINPAITQHLIEGYLGGLVSVYLRGGEQIGKAFSGEEISMNDIPIARRVYSIADKQVYDNSTRREYFDIYNDLKKGVDHKLQKYNKIVNEYDARFNKGEETPTQEDLERWGLYLDKLNKLKQTKDYYKLKEYKAAEKAQKLWEKEGTPFDEANLMKQVVDNVKLIDDAEAAKRVKAEAEAEAQTEEEITD